MSDYSPCGSVSPVRRRYRHARQAHPLLGPDRKAVEANPADRDLLCEISNCH